MWSDEGAVFNPSRVFFRLKGTRARREHVKVEASVNLARKKHVSFREFGRNEKSQLEETSTNLENISSSPLVINANQIIAYNYDNTKSAENIQMENRIIHIHIYIYIRHVPRVESLEKFTELYIHKSTRM